MNFEIYKELIVLYIEIVEKIKTLKTAKSACDVAVNAMMKFSTKKNNFADEIDNFVNILYATNELSQFILDVENKIFEVEKKFGSVDGVYHEVMYMRDIERKSLKEIADELGYSYGYIKNISAKNPRKTIGV